MAQGKARSRAYRFAARRGGFCQSTKGTIAMQATETNPISKISDDRSRAVKAIQ